MAEGVAVADVGDEAGDGKIRAWIWTWREGEEWEDVLIVGGGDDGCIVNTG